LAWRRQRKRENERARKDPKEEVQKSRKTGKEMALDYKAEDKFSLSAKREYSKGASSLHVENTRTTEQKGSQGTIDRNFKEGKGSRGREEGKTSKKRI